MIRYDADCDKPGSVCQDPRFIGGDGLTFYFHGKKDTNFCLISDPNLHINAHFIGKRRSGMARDFTWVQSIAILFGTHRLYVGALKTATWDDSVDRISISFDGNVISLPQLDGAKWTSSRGVSPYVSVKRVNADTNNLEVRPERLLLKPQETKSKYRKIISLGLQFFYFIKSIKFLYLVIYTQEHLCE